MQQTSQLLGSYHTISNNQKSDDLTNLPTYGRRARHLSHNSTPALRVNLLVTEERLGIDFHWHM